MGVIDWTFVGVVVAGTLTLAVHWRVWRDRGALRSLLLIISAAVAFGAALGATWTLTFDWLYRLSPLTAYVVSYVLILAGIVHVVRMRQRMKRRPRNS